MAEINTNYDKLAAGYLFPEIAKRTKTFQAANPGVQIYRLGIGNTTEHIEMSLQYAEDVGRGLKKGNTQENATGNHQ